MADSDRCGHCGETGVNSYWLIDHLEHCPVRWHHQGHHHHHHHWHDTRTVTVTVEWQGEVNAYCVPLTDTSRKVHIHMADLVVRDSDPDATVSVTLLDAQGNPTTPDTIPEWAEDSNGTVLTLTPAADGLSATLSWKAPGTSNVTFSVTDNDGTKVVGTGSVQVDPGEAVKVQLNFTPGQAPTPAPQPSPAPTP